MNKSKHRILVVPNEDGFGPSALVSYIVKAILSRESKTQITIWNKSRFSYNCSLYKDYIEKGNVKVLKIWNIIQLNKMGGEVSIPGTLGDIGDYRSLSKQYPFNPPSIDFDLVLDFGVPAAVKWAAKRGIRSVSVFDHSWSKTLLMILEDLDKFHPGDSKAVDSFRSDWHKLVEDIKKDETLTQQLFIFPPFITPTVFRDYWEQIMGKSAVRQIDTVLGGYSESKEEAQKQALSCLAGITEIRGELSGKAILIQGGDTPVWDNVLKKIVPAFVATEEKLNRRELNIVINIPDRLVNDLDIKTALENQKFNRVRRLGFVPGGTIQDILPAIDFLVTRAGGGTVNDTVACRVPFVCVREPTQSQTEAILKVCL